MLHRLVKKNVLTYERQGNRYVYRSRVQRSDCIQQASRSFLDRVFGGRQPPFWLDFLRVARLTPDEVAQLRQILNEQDRKP